MIRMNLSSKGGSYSRSTAADISKIAALSPGRKAKLESLVTRRATAPMVGDVDALGEITRQAVKEAVKEQKEESKKTAINESRFKAFLSNTWEFIKTWWYVILPAGFILAFFMIIKKTRAVKKYTKYRR